MFNYDGRINIINSKINENSSTVGGGLWGGNVLNLTKALMKENKAESGAGIFNSSKSTATLIDSKIEQNSALKNGGGILNEGDLTLISSLVAENRAIKGAGIYTTNSLLVLDSEVINNCPNDIVKG